jgi:hypothetical protein
MRGLESLMLAALSVGGVAVWHGDKLVPQFSSSNRVPVIISASPVVYRQPVDNRIHRAAGRALRNTASDVNRQREHFGALEPASNDPTGSIVVDVPAPTPQCPPDVSLGVSRSALREKYGEPTFDVTARQQGQLVERYYYYAKDVGRLTVATLRDGRVVDTQAVAY